MAINVPLNAQLQNATQLQQQVQNAVNAVRINLGGANGARSLSALSQPLGRLTGQADEFTKSLDAANARVLAFGASVGVVNAVSNAFKALVSSTIEVEKALTEISVVGDQFNGKTKQLSQGLFDIAKNTGQSFAEVSRAALEFSRQGLNLEETLARTKDALILTRTTGLDAAKSVEGLSAAVSAFAKAGLSTAQVINKLGAVDKAFKVSSADLIQAFERTGAVAQQAGVSFDELAGIVTALQSDTSRGGAVIGNALKTIFSRLQDTSTLTQLQNLGIAVEDLQGNVLPARQILQNLANDIQGLSKLTQAGIFKDVAGTFQLNQLVSLVNDLGRAQGIAAKATEISSGATNEAYIANEKLNQSLDAILNKLATTGKQFGALLGEIGFSDNLKGILDGINNFIEQVTDVLQGDDLGSKFAKGIVKGIGSVLSGPGFMVFLAIIAKLSFDLAKFGAQSLKTFFNIGKAANDQKQIQESIVQVLLRNQNVLNQIVSTQGGQNAQAQAFLGILNQQAAAMQTIQGLAGNIAGTVYGAGYRQTGQGLARRSAGGYLPAQEAADVRRGVGGASPSSKVVAIPNFAFGGGKRGTMIANTSEYIVPNYAGGGSAIFNQDMVKTMGLPAGAKKIGAAGGFVPNFAAKNRLKEGRDLESRIFGFLNLPPAGNRNLDFPYSVLSGVKTESKARLGIQGTFGDLKLTDSQENRTSLLGRLIQEFNLFDELQKLTYKKKTAQNIDLNSLNPRIQEAALFFKGNPSIFESIPIEASWAAIRKANRDKPNFLSKFDPIIYRPDGALKAGATGSKISAKIFRDGVLDPKDIAAQGYIPNFANFKNSDLAVLGLYGRNSDIDGSPVYTLQNQRPEISKDIVRGYKNRIAGFVNGYAKQVAKNIGIEVSPKEVIKSFAQASNISGFIFEDVLNQLAGPNFDSNRISGGARADFPLTTNLRKVFGVTGTQRYAEIKLSPNTTDSIASVRAKQAALAGGALTPVELTSSQESSLRAEAIALGIGKPGRSDPKTQAQRGAFIKKMIDSGLIKSGYGTAADQSKAIKRVLGIASTGYIPNFADLDGDGVVTQRDGFYQRLKSAAKKYSKNPTVDFILNQVLQSMLGLPEGVDVMETVKACDKALKALKPEDELNKILRKESAAKKAQKRQSFLKGYYNSSSGYIPNFAASALQQAIAREKSAGLSDAQIYIDQNPSLKSPQNPMGLMVANTRDEPFGGIQGISRARKEGMNPKTYGAANGFVPNYAVPSGLSGYAASLNQPTNANNSEKVNKGFGEMAGKIFLLQGALSFMSGAVGEATTSFEKFTQQAAISLGNISSLAIFGKEIRGINIEATGMKGALGKFAKNAGLAGVAIGIAVEGFDFLNFAIKEFSGENEKAALASAKLADASDKLSIKFESLSKTRQTQVSTQAEKILGSAGYEGFFNSIANFFRSEKIGGGDIGANTEVKKGISQLLALGASQKEIEGVLEKSKKFEERKEYYQGGAASYIQSQDITQASDVIAGLEESMTAATGLGKKLSDQFLKFSSQIEDIDFNASNAKDAIKKIQDTIYGKSVSPELTATLEEEVKRQEQDFKIKLAKQTLEFEKPINVLKRALGTIIFESGLAIEKISQQLERESQVISAITSSKSFATLGDSSRIAFEINSSIDQFQKQYKNQISKFTQETQKSLLEYIPQLGIGKDNSAIIEAQVRTVGAATTKGGLQSSLEDFQEKLKKFGVNLDLPKFEELKNKITETISNFDNLNQNLNVQEKILALQNQERILEAQAYDTYRNNLAGFVEQTVKSAKSIAALRGEIERIAITQESNITARTAVSKTGREDVIIRGEEELKAFRDRRDKETAILFEEQAMAAKQQFFTKENIAELNRNTEALNDLRMVLAQDFINKIDDSIKIVQNIPNVTGARIFQGASTPLPTGITLPSGINNSQDALNYLQNLRRAYSPVAPGLNTGVNLTTAEADLNKITAAIRGGSSFADVQAQINTLSKNEVYVNQLTEYARKMYEAAQTSAATMEENEITLKEQVKANIRNYDIINSYGTKLNNSLKSVRDSLTDPQTRGELLSKLGVIRRGEKEQELGTEAEKRNYRSSFGYGFDEAMDKLRARTEDFRNQLGQEIPDLFSQNLAQGLNDAISGAKDLKTALTDAATAFFQEITRKNISNLADLATRGLGSLAQTGFGALGFASGGFIKGGSGTKDDVPAMLMGGEYVVKKSAVNKYGKSFLDAINNGNMRGYATGGMVDPQTFPTQTGRGGFFTPGDYGQGAITGKNELLTFASQSFTGGQYDYMGGFGMGGATVSLEPESARLSALGREGSPMFERVQQSKDEAFKVYLEGLQKEKEYAELLDQISKAEKARKKQLQTAIISAVVSSALSYAGSRGQTGAKNKIAAEAAQAGVTELTGLAKTKAGVSGFVKGIFSSSGKGLTPQAENYYQNLSNIKLNKQGFSAGKIGPYKKGYGSVVKTSGAAKYSAPSSALPLPTALSPIDSNIFLLPSITDGRTDGYYNPHPVRKAFGGLISGGSNIRDDVPAMLTGGEFVLNNRATQRIGLQNLNKLNSGATVSSEGSSPEMTQTLIAKLDELIQTTANSSKENVVVNVSTNEASGQAAENPAGTEKELHKKIRQAVLDVIAQEKRLGGSLEKSR